MNPYGPDREMEYDRFFSKHPPTCDVCEVALTTPDGRWSWCEPIEKWSYKGKVCHARDCFEPTPEYSGWAEWIGEEDGW